MTGTVHPFEYECDLEKNPVSTNEKPPGNQRTRRSFAAIDIKYNQENLGENFEETPWVPPSIPLVSCS